MNKYLCIDTNIFIQCCLLEQEGDDIGALNKLSDLLNQGTIQLLLPEVVEIEFFRRLADKTVVMQRQIDKLKEIVGKDQELDKKFKNDILGHLTKVMDIRLENKLNVEEKIRKIFSHENTIKEGLKITPDLIVDAFKYHLSGMKPYKKTSANQQVLQADCLIVKSLNKFLQGRSDFKLYLCSLNDQDFADESSVSKEVKIENPPIHPEIKSHFHHIEYRRNLLNLLNEEFGASFSLESISKLEEQAINIQSIADSAFSNFQIPIIPQFNIPEIPTVDFPKIPEIQIPVFPKFDIPTIPEFRIPTMPRIDYPIPFIAESEGENTVDNSSDDSII